ncbi:KH domain-containing protein [Terribacillus halophilus]|nr:KH domain-containing protein [Terribacillus halophilus]
MKALIEAMVAPLVDFPEQIVVRQREEQQKVIYQLQVHESDIGKVIGKDGRNARALRTVLRAAADDHKKRIYLDIC